MSQAILLVLLNAFMPAPVRCEPALCTCIPIPPATSRAMMQKQAASYDAVFEGRVVALTRDDSRIVTDTVPFRPRKSEVESRVVARVVVERRWRGAVADTALIATPTSTTACGFDFEVGRHYLVFAEGSGPVEWNILKCGLTAPAGKARRQRRLLGSPLPSGGSARGAR